MTRRISDSAPLYGCLIVIIAIAGAALIVIGLGKLGGIW